MKILHVITQKPFDTGSGVYLSGIMEELGSDHEQYLICGLSSRDEMDRMPAYTSDPVLFNQDDLPFEVPGMSNVMPYPSRRYDSLNEEETAAMKQAFLTKIAKAVQKFQPDVILCQHIYLVTAWTAAWIRLNAPCIPVIGVCHGSDLRQFRNNGKWRDEISSGIRQLSAVVVTHREQAEDAAGLLGLSLGSIHVLGSGFNNRVFTADPAVQKDLSPLRIVYTGKLAKAKGVPELITACDELSREMELSLTLIGSAGDPEEAEEIRRMGASARFPVTFTGQLPQNRVADIYRNSHIFVLPSYYEGMPLVIPEALSCGMKVAVTHLPGFENWLADFRDRVRLIPQPAMAEVDIPTEAGKKEFILDITRSLRELAALPNDLPQPDMEAMSWKGLASRLSVLMRELGKKGTPF